MGNLADYFEKTAYKAKYNIGDRVHGYWNKIPFVGTVGNDSCVDGANPRISIHLDLPIKYAERVHNIIFATHRDVKGYLKELTDRI